MRSACFIAYRSVSYLGVIEILLLHTDQTHTTGTGSQLHTHPKTPHTHFRSKIHTHTVSINTHTGRGQSNKLGVRAADVRGLSMVRRAFKVLPNCYPEASCSSFLVFHIDCCIYTDKRRGERKLKKRSGGIFGVFLISLIHEGRGFPLTSAGTSCFHAAPTDSR